MQCSAVQCSWGKFSAVQCSAMPCISMQCIAMQCSGVQCSAVQCSSVECNAVQCNAVQCSTVQCSSVQCSAYIADIAAVTGCSWNRVHWQIWSSNSLSLADQSWRVIKQYKSEWNIKRILFLSLFLSVVLRKAPTDKKHLKLGHWPFLMLRVCSQIMSATKGGWEGLANYGIGWQRGEGGSGKKIVLLKYLHIFWFSGITILSRFFLASPPHVNLDMF